MNISEQAIEKAARAIHGYPDAVWRNETTNSKNYFREKARAALEAAAPLLMAQAWDEGAEQAASSNMDAAVAKEANPYEEN